MRKSMLRFQTTGGSPDLPRILSEHDTVGVIFIPMGGPLTGRSGRANVSPQDETSRHLIRACTGSKDLL